MPGEHTAVAAASNSLEHTLIGYVLGILPTRIGDGRANLTIAIRTVALRAGIEAELLLTSLGLFRVIGIQLGVRVDACFQELLCFGVSLSVALIGNGLLSLVDTSLHSAIANEGMVKPTIANIEIVNVAFIAVLPNMSSPRFINKATS